MDAMTTQSALVGYCSMVSVERRARRGYDTIVQSTRVASSGVIETVARIYRRASDPFDEETS